MDDFVVEIRESASTPRPCVLTGVTDVGRECDGIVVADPMVSRRHVRFSVSGQTLRVSDLDSSNGTLVNGVSMSTTPM